MTVLRKNGWKGFSPTLAKLRPKNKLLERFVKSIFISVQIQRRWTSGRSKTNAELTALPLDHPYRGTTLHHISRLQINLKLRQNKSKEIREIIMNLAPAYDKWLEEVEAKAIAKCGTEAQISIARRMLKRNASIEEIANDTGLSIELLQQLRSNDSFS